MTEISLPDSLTSIGIWAFLNCNAITVINYDTVKPLSISDYRIFDESVYEAATLHVAPGGKEKAAVTEPWKNFLDIKEKEFTGFEEIMVDFDNSLPITVYDLNGVYMASGVDNLAPGFYIVRQGNKSKKNSYKIILSLFLTKSLLFSTVLRKNCVGVGLIY